MWYLSRRDVWLPEAVAFYSAAMKRFNEDCHHHEDDSSGELKAFEYHADLSRNRPDAEIGWQPRIV
jgi:hypothetical protein